MRHRGFRRGTRRHPAARPRTRPRPRPNGPLGLLRGLRGGPRRGHPADPRGALIGGPHGLRLTCAGLAPRVTGGACGLPPRGDLDAHAGSVRGPSLPWRGRAAGLRAAAALQ
eukprot:gene21048-biopygen13161